MNQPNRSYHIVLLGATGFTGRLVAEYLWKQYGHDQELRWAMAGRDLEKLEQVRAEIGAESIPLLVADNHDRGSLDVLVAQTQVICSTVGPYALHGSELIAACVEGGADYCDLTGEVQWMRRMIDEHQEAASAKGVRLVFTCGFDSIPSDMGTFFMQREAKARHGAYCKQVKFRLSGGSGGFSGGTAATLFAVLDEVQQDTGLRRMLANPYSLNPKGEREGNDRPALRRVEYDSDACSYFAPFAMEFINGPVVRRAHALAGYPYGKDFRYDEAMLTGRGIKGWLTGWFLTLGMGLLLLGRRGSPLRWLINRLLPKPGEGPSREKRENGYFKVRFYGKLEDGTLIRASVTGGQDPGYGSTSKMLGESAVCLALDRDKTPERTGFLSPSTAMGAILLDRLEEKAGLKFSFQD